MKKIFSSQEIKFILVFAGIFVGTVFILSIFGLLPSEFKSEGGPTFEQRAQSAVREILEGSNQSKSPLEHANNQDVDVIGGKSSIQVTTTSQSNGSNHSTGNIIYAENPIRIVIPSIGVDSIILNPTSNKHEILDAELTKGVVRYPGSGLPGAGNMFLFGHSTSFSVVQNQAYKVFNELHTLNAGDTIIIHGKEGIYTYTVKTVRKVDKDNALVKFDTKNNMITLSTCDSFGKPSDRYVVEGDLMSVARK